jgi:hypothetical protein
MKRITVVGLCLMAVLAMSAVVASSAFAGAEVGECVKNLTKTGKYADKGCQTLSVGENTGKYDWKKGVTAEHAATTAKSKTASLVGAAGTIECKKSSSVGEWTGNKTNEEVVTFVGCEIKSPELTGECHSSGQAEGTIVTNKLKTTLLGAGDTSLEFNSGTSKYEPKTVGAGEVWNQFRGPSGELESVQAEYECGKVVVIKTFGNLAGVFSAGSINVASKKAEIAFDEGKGAQGLLSEANILGKGFVPIGKGVEKVSAKAKGVAKLVISSVEKT